MNDRSIAILSTGLVTSVGLSAPASCAAIRAKISNPTETRFIDSNGEWIMAHQVQLNKPWRGRAKLAKMAAMAIEECLQGVERSEWSRIPLLLCVAEKDRPGRMEGLDDLLFNDIEAELQVRLGSGSAILAHGRVSVMLAMEHARSLLFDHASRRVLVAAADSLNTWPTLSAYELEQRLLTETNSNGFIPGEAAGALLLCGHGTEAELLCRGIGFGEEESHIYSTEPLRADGLSMAIRKALLEAGQGVHELDFRITDVSGEQYGFKLATLSLARLLHERKAEFDIWHPAECVGEVGSAIGTVLLATADAACRNHYALGRNILVHASDDHGRCAAVVLRFEGAA